MLFQRILFVLLALWSPRAFSVPASADEVTDLQILQETGVWAPGETAHLGLRIRTLIPGWHTYWTNPGDAGAPPKVRIESEVPVEAGPLLFPPPERFETKTLIAFGYEGDVLFPLALRIPETARPGRKIRLTINAEWLVCEEICIPARKSEDVELTIGALSEVRPGPHFEDFRKVLASLPPRAPTAARLDETAGTVNLEIPPALGSIRPLDFFADALSGLALQKPAFTVRAGLVSFPLRPADYFEGKREPWGLLTFMDSKGSRRALQWGPEPKPVEVITREPEASPGTMLLFAFLGGLLLNLMPCVFPVLSLKLMSLAKQSQFSHNRIRLENLAYTAGVVLSFMALGGILAALRASGELMGWGFQLQSPAFVSALVLLFFLLSLNFLGAYEVSFLNPNWGDSLTRKRDLTGSFFTGVFAVLVASPCTAPFMGAALGFGLTQGTALLLSIFFFLGLGLAFPYLLFALVPRAAKALPRPGPWMKTLKEFMAFPLLATVLWLLTVLHGVSGFAAVVVLLTAFLGLAFALWIRPAAWRWGLIAVTTVAALVFVPTEPSSGTAGAADPKAAADGRWAAFDPTMLDPPRKRPLFVNFTADWCLTCKVNERLVLGGESLHAHFRDEGILAVKADWTRRDPAIAAVLSRYGRAGVPMYLLLPEGSGRPRLLPEVLTEEMIRNEIRLMKTSMQGGEQ